MVFCTSSSTAPKFEDIGNLKLKDNAKLVSITPDYDEYINNAIERSCIGNSKEEMITREPKKTHPGHRLIDFA